MRTVLYKNGYRKIRELNMKENDYVTDVTGRVGVISSETGIIPMGPVGNYTEEILTAFKHALSNKARAFGRGRKRRPMCVQLGQNQLKMLRQDSTAQWMLENVKIEEVQDESKICYK